MMKKEKLIPWVMAAGYLILCALALFLFSRYAGGGGEQIYLTPVGSSAEGWEIYVLEDGKKQALSPEEYWERDGTVYLERVIDPAWEAAGYTDRELSSRRQPSSLFLDGQLFYTTIPGGGESQEWARCTLPPGCGGKTLTVVTGAGTGMILTGEAVDKRNTIALTNRLGMPAAAFGLAALFLLGLFLYALSRGKRDWPRSNCWGPVFSWRAPMSAHTRSSAGPRTAKRSWNC